MINIDDIDDATFHKMIATIDARYQKEALDPMVNAFIDFFTKIQNFEDGYRTDVPSKKIEIVNIFYYAPSTLSFIFAMSDLEYYKVNNEISRPELHMDSYEDYDEHKMIVDVLKKQY
jgi:hypothetical protein